MPILFDAFLIHYKCQNKQPLVTKDEGQLKLNHFTSLQFIEPNK